MNSMRYDYTPPKVKKMYIPVRSNTRPGILREDTLGIVIHHTACEDVPAMNFYQSIQRENYTDFASYHIVVDFDGTVYIFIPVDEMAYGSGSGHYDENLNKWVHHYSAIGKDIFNSEPWKKTVDIEACCATPDYYINNRQQEVIADVSADLCINYNRHTNKDLYKHFSIALDKPYCPAYFIKGLNWQRFLSMAKTMYNKKLNGEMSRLDLY